MQQPARQTVTSIDQLSEQAIELALARQWPEAAIVNREIIAMHPNDVGALNRLGNALVEISDPKRASQAYQAALNRKRDILILDTAGRLHTKGKLMEELKKIRRVLQKNDPTLPHHSWLVIDGSIGSNSIEQARQFNEQFGLTGLIITKLDGASRGGSIISIYQELKLPVYFVGLGEKAEDLLPFTVDNYVNALLGLEKA